MLPKGWDLSMNFSEKKGGVFLRVPAESSVEVAFRGSPKEVFSDFTTKRVSSTPFPNCSTRIRINVILNDDDYNCKIFEFGPRLWDDIKDEVGDYGLDAWYLIQRKGSTKENTRWRVKFKRPLGDEKAQIERVKLFDLEPKVLGKVEEEKETMDDIPF